MEAAREQHSKLDHFRSWLQVNGVEMRGCDIRLSDSGKGFGIYSSGQSSDGNCSDVLLVVPLDLAITPMRVLQDPTVGEKCRAMFKEGDVDDRFLIILYLTVERLRKNSSWAPYFDVLPTTFESSLWFERDELAELTGTALHRATKLQKESLHALFVSKVKQSVEELLAGELEREVLFEDFLWANSIFWSRALNIPLPRSYIFPHSSEEHDKKDTAAAFSEFSTESCQIEVKHNSCKECIGAPSASSVEKSIWVEGLIPGIDFCNHDLKASATWEVDNSGSKTGVPSSMYLLSAEQGPLHSGKEIVISYGDKGNEELLFLYGFVLENNPDDYLMVHYPMEALQSDPSADVKAQLLQIQQVGLRCLLPRGLLANGYFTASKLQDGEKDSHPTRGQPQFSWSGQRNVPSYLSKPVFPEEFLAALRTVAMKNDDILQVSTLLEDLVVPGGERQPSDTEVRAAVWEVCGDAGALQLLIDLLQAKILELEECTGTEDADADLLERDNNSNLQRGKNKMSRKKWSSVVYRHGQKHLARLFLKEAEHALHLFLTEE